MDSTGAAIEQIESITREVTYLTHAAAVLAWDQETFLPPQAIEERAQQLSLLSGLAHRRLTGDDLGQALQAVEGASLDWPYDRMVRQVRRMVNQAIKLPEAFVRQMAQATSESQMAWAKARSSNDFAAFRPHLERIVDLCGQKTGFLGYQTEAYDALLDEYEPDITTAVVDRVFEALAKDLIPLVETLAARPAPDAAFLNRDYPIADQTAFGNLVLATMGFDFKRGRLDQSAHPFSTTLGRSDVRITTYWHQTDPMKGLYAIIHEAGHALYELGVDPTLPPVLASGTSLGIHESQSRLWENLIGRSRQFWEYFFPKLQTYFPTQLAKSSAAQLYRAVNRVQPSNIRIHADEVTYSLHVMIRFRLELAILRGQLAVRDLPEAWRAESQKLLGVTPDSDAEGCLQDIHWSMGAFGYFPTYVLGNLYGAMFMQQARRALPNLDDQVAQGQFSPLRTWLIEHIHRYGLAKKPAELLQDICGQPLSHQAFVTYLKQKYLNMGEA